MFGSRTNARPRVTRSHAVSQPVQALEQRVVLSGGMLGGMAKSVNSQAAAQVAATIEVKWPASAQQNPVGDNRAQLATDPRTATFRPELGVRETIPPTDLGASVETKDFGLVPQNPNPLNDPGSSKLDSGRLGAFGTEGNDEQAFLEGLQGLLPRNSHRPGGDATKYAGSISTDPAQMLAGAKGSLTSDGPTRNGTLVNTVDNGNGTSSQVYVDDSGNKTVVTRDSNGQEIERRTDEHNPRTGESTRTETHRTGGALDSVVITTGRSGGPLEKFWWVRSERGQWDTNFGLGGTGRGGGGSTRLPPPDGGEGAGGSGWLPGKEPAKPWQRDPNPGIRPDESATAPSGPQLDVKVNLTGQPNPTEGAYSGSPVYTGYKPSDYVNPSRG